MPPRHLPGAKRGARARGDTSQPPVCLGAGWQGRNTLFEQGLGFEGVTRCQNKYIKSTRIKLKK